MNKTNQDRSKILLKATFDILSKCDSGIYVKNVMEESAVWDDAECDGYCLLEELRELLSELNIK